MFKPNLRETSIPSVIKMYGAPQTPPPTGLAWEQDQQTLHKIRRIIYKLSSDLKEQAGIT
jgi:hypothetical protein